RGHAAVDDATRAGPRAAVVANEARIPAAEEAREHPAVSTADGDVPAFRVVHGGDPGPEALAALVVALTSGGPARAQRATRRSGWTDRRALLRRPLDHGPGHWVASARPTR